jgi:hypothetical protein
VTGQLLTGSAPEGQLQSPHPNRGGPAWTLKTAEAQVLAGVVGGCWYERLFLTVQKWITCLVIALAAVLPLCLLTASPARKA